MRQLRCHGNYRQQRGTQEEGRPWPQTHYGSGGGQAGRQGNHGSGEAPRARLGRLLWRGSQDGVGGRGVSGWPLGAGLHAPKGTLRQPHRVARRPG